MKRVLTIAAWNICVIFALLALIELGLRFTPFDTARHPAANNPPDYYVADGTLGIRIKPNFPDGWFEFRGPGHKIFSNEFGCFDRPLKLKKDEPYALAIGDSFTWGYNPLEEKWTSIIERKTGVRVLKCGVAGTGTKYQLRLLRQLLEKLPHPPQTVIHLYDTTDFNDDFIFPGETVLNGKRIDDFQKIRLSDGKHFKDGPASDSEVPDHSYGIQAPKKNRPLVLPSLLKIAFMVDGQVEKRRLVLEGLNPEYLRWRYEFNLLLLDAAKYPHVSKKLDEHIEALKDVRQEVQDAGASYVLFHTNSFRLPKDRPLVQRLNRFFASVPEFKGRAPELGRHLFDPHWNAESEKKVAEFMLERMKQQVLISEGRRTRSLNVVNRTVD
ncbi:MAG: SGNH/GDSL hydrolase family protein [Hyphomicrobiaceae bacterium]|nr:SGNH/GDSL hydrolase family protein [Hyphomicrobiaceae bacterium]